MHPNKQTILITGAAGFIGGYLAHVLAKRAEVRLILSDDFTRADKSRNWSDLQDVSLVPRTELIEQLNAQVIRPDWIIHLGARTDTTEFDYSIHETLNLNFSKQIWTYCCQQQVPLIYASSAATYGNGDNGYSDDTALLPSLKPLNPYGLSKHQFDCWVVEQAIQPPHWYGLKFFNVYGFRESHKGRMASMVYHGFQQIRERGQVRLFKSHRAGIADGEQRRDFIYVKDVIGVIDWLMNRLAPVGIYNLGTGQARSFNDLIRAVFQAMNLPANIEYFDMPVDLRDSYQYFTEAPMEKLRLAGYPYNFYSLEEGVGDYLRNYLVPDQASA
ncbi:MAG: ADP-glyceromanno-heptose 6-epimerase [Bacteroidetes bacterium]|nr:ADP-glyceromanno-heptose 6-epimerase [Bacteroidota bacterium]